MTYFNNAPLAWEKGDYPLAVALYEKAQTYTPDDPYVKMFLGLNYLFLGKKGKGTKIFKEIADLPFDEAVSKETFPEDYLKKKVDIEGLKTIFLPVDETRESILNKQLKLKKVVKKYPQFRAGLFSLAVT